MLVILARVLGIKHLSLCPIPHLERVQRNYDIILKLGHPPFATLPLQIPILKPPNRNINKQLADRRRLLALRINHLMKIDRVLLLLA